jgi:outer membrane biogenesis lipoprotein LolB
MWYVCILSQECSAVLSCSCVSDSIEANVDRAYTIVEQGTQQLGKASDYQVKGNNSSKGEIRKTNVEQGTQQLGKASDYQVKGNSSSKGEIIKTQL